MTSTKPLVQEVTSAQDYFTRWLAVWLVTRERQSWRLDVIDKDRTQASELG